MDAGGPISFAESWFRLLVARRHPARDDSFCSLPTSTAPSEYSATLPTGTSYFTAGDLHRGNDVLLSGDDACDAGYVYRLTLLGLLDGLLERWASGAIAADAIASAVVWQRGDEEHDIHVDYGTAKAYQSPWQDALRDCTMFNDSSVSVPPRMALARRCSWRDGKIPCPVCAEHSRVDRDDGASRRL